MSGVLGSEWDAHVAELRAERETSGGRARLAARDAMEHVRDLLGWDIEEAVRRGDVPVSVWSVAADVQHEMGRAAAWTLVWLLTPEGT